MAIEGLSDEDELFLTQQVYEYLYEPMYKTEVYRKLENRGGDWLKRQVFEAIDNLVGDDRLSIDFVQVQHEETHGLSSISGPGGEWYDYVLVWVPSDKKENEDLVETALERDLKPFMDPSEKREIINRISEQGLINAVNTERVFQDLIDEQFGDVRKSDFNSPQPDAVAEDEKVVFEVSNRYENPVEKSYVENKMDYVRMGYDVVIVAPRFTGFALQQYSESEFVHLVPHLPHIDSYFVLNPETFFTDLDVNQVIDDFDAVERDFVIQRETRFKDSVWEEISEVL